jgi:hypothetical protein
MAYLGALASHSGQKINNKTNIDVSCSRDLPVAVVSCQWSISQFFLNTSCELFLKITPPQRRFRKM